MSILLPRMNLFDASKLKVSSSSITMDISEDTYTITVVGGSRVTWARAEYYLDDDLVKQLAGKTLYFATDNINKSLEEAKTVIYMRLVFSDGTDKYYEPPASAAKRCSIPEDTTSIRISLVCHNSNNLLEGDNVAVFEGVRLTLYPDAPWEAYRSSDKVKMYIPGTNLIDVTKNPSYSKNDTFVVSSDGYRIETTKLADDTDTYVTTEYRLDDLFVQSLVGKTVYLMADNFSSILSDVRASIQLTCTLDDESKKYFVIVHKPTGTNLSVVCAIPSNTVNMKIGIYTNNNNIPLTADNTVVVEGLRLTLTENAPWEKYTDGLVKKIFLGDLLVYTSEEVIYENGVLAEGILSENGFTNQDGYLYARVDDDHDADDESTVKLVGIEGIDFTEYNRVDIKLTTDTSAYTGSSAYIQYGIGYQWEGTDYTYLVRDTEDDLVEHTLTIDMSNYTGKQDIYFRLRAKNNSSTYEAHAELKIFEIKMYNE